MATWLNLLLMQTGQRYILTRLMLIQSQMGLFISLTRISLQSPDSVFELRICLLCRRLARGNSTRNGLIAFVLHSYMTVRNKYE